MGVFEELAISEPVNARGTFTPLGVSRSAHEVGEITAKALGAYLCIEELQQAASARLVRFSGVEAGTVVHCAAAAITLAVAACMTREDAAAVARLPDSDGLSRQVLLPVGHNVNYGQPVEQAVRLAGGKPHLIGNAAECTLKDIETALSLDGVCCLLLVSSRLTRGREIDMKAAAGLARARGIPVIIDGAAQDMRVRQLVETGAELVILSGQKYLAGPTAGLIVGARTMIAAVRAQEKGIGRGMKASKEAIAGTLAALDLRANLNLAEWQAVQSRKLEQFLKAANLLPAVNAIAEADPTGLPFARAMLELDPAVDAAEMVLQLQAHRPPIFVMEHQVSRNALVLEIAALRDDELDVILTALGDFLA